tara:strand:+ start:1313 stop:2185 length:873 start_codon:yes stop_codon:yes gene_type:complete
MVNSDKFSFFQRIIFKIVTPFLSDEQFCHISLIRWDIKKPNLKNPKTFNEKIRWLSLNDRNPKYHHLADKLRIKEIIKKKIGKDYVVKLIDHWNSPNEINFSKLPNKFVLKTNNGCGTNILVKDKSKLNLTSTRKLLRKFMNLDLYRTNREWVYKDIPKKVFAEELIEDKEGKAPNDYKFLCFNGVPKIILVNVDKSSVMKQAFFTTKWELMPISRFDNTEKASNIEKPKNLKEMINVAKKLSKGIRFVRIDLYSIPEVKFGEITFYPGGGIKIFKPIAWNKKIGDLIEI